MREMREMREIRDMREIREIEMIDADKEKCDSKQESSTILDLLTFPPPHTAPHFHPHEGNEGNEGNKRNEGNEGRGINIHKL